MPDVAVTLRARQLSFISDPDGLVLPDEAQPFDSWPRVTEFRAKVGPADTTLGGSWNDPAGVGPVLSVPNGK